SINNIPDAMQNFATQLCSEECQYLNEKLYGIKSVGGNMTPSSLLTNWMRRTGWEELFNTANKKVLIAFSTLPLADGQNHFISDYNRQALQNPALDESKMHSITVALDLLFDCCYNIVRHIDIIIRWWLRGGDFDSLYKAPFELIY
ncbi:hypothetical protein BGZ63DRAFT_358609, partial [Mariannaea sp. PMI_226]